MLHVSVTGLRLRSIWHFPVFAFHAVRSMRQARQAPGNLRAEARWINGVAHTLTVWESRDHMITYLRQGAHLQAMRSFRRIATGRVHGFPAETMPGWDKALIEWRDNGRDY